MNTKPGETIAIFQYANGKRKSIKSTVLGGIYSEWLDYNGLFAAGATSDITANFLRGLEYDCKSGEVKVLQSPHNLYHCWHVCTCGECESGEDIWGKFGGKVWSHSQGDWDSHLRYVANDRVFTFPSVNPE